MLQWVYLDVMPTKSWASFFVFRSMISTHNVRNISLTLFSLLFVFTTSPLSLSRRQCDQIWRNFATLANVYKNLAYFWQFISYLATCILWQIWDIIGLNIITTNGQILKNNVTIWSHCSSRLHPCKSPFGPIVTKVLQSSIYIYRDMRIGVLESEEERKGESWKIFFSFFKKWAILASFPFIFSLFRQTNNTILQQMNVFGRLYRASDNSDNNGSFLKRIYIYKRNWWVSDVSLFDSFSGFPLMGIEPRIGIMETPSTRSIYNYSATTSVIRFGEIPPLWQKN